MSRKKSHTPRIIPQIPPTSAIRYRLEKVLQEAAHLRILLTVATQLEASNADSIEPLASELEGGKHDS